MVARIFFLVLLLGKKYKNLYPSLYKPPVADQIVHWHNAPILGSFEKKASSRTFVPHSV